MTGNDNDGYLQRDIELDRPNSIGNVRGHVPSRSHNRWPACHRDELEPRALVREETSRCFDWDDERSKCNRDNSSAVCLRQVSSLDDWRIRRDESCSEALFASRRLRYSSRRNRYLDQSKLRQSRSEVHWPIETFAFVYGRSDWPGLSSVHRESRLGHVHHFLSGSEPLEEKWGDSNRPTNDQRTYFNHSPTLIFVQLGKNSFVHANKPTAIHYRSPTGFVDVEGADGVDFSLITGWDNVEDTSDAREDIAPSANPDDFGTWIGLRDIDVIATFPTGILYFSIVAPVDSRHLPIQDSARPYRWLTPQRSLQIRETRSFARTLNLGNSSDQQCNKLHSVIALLRLTDSTFRWIIIFRTIVLIMFQRRKEDKNEQLNQYFPRSDKKTKTR